MSDTRDMLIEIRNDVKHTAKEVAGLRIKAGEALDRIADVDKAAGERSAVIETRLAAVESQAHHAEAVANAIVEGDKTEARQAGREAGRKAGGIIGGSIVGGGGIGGIIYIIIEKWDGITAFLGHLFGH